MQIVAQEKRGEEHAGRRSVLLVGNPALPLKGFDVALAVLAMVNRVLPLDVTWICQTHPTPAMVSGLASCGLRISLHVSPSQVRMVGCAHTLQVSLLSWTGEQVANDSVPLNLMQCLWYVFFGCVLFWIMTMGHKLVIVWAPLIQKHPCYYAGCCHIAGQSVFGSILVSVLLSK